MSKSSVKGLILMGGQSIRMGTDKAFVLWQGKTLLERVIENLSGNIDDIYLSVNADQYEVLNSSYNCILDKYPDKGPLAGILSALETLHEDVIVLAVDMPNLDGKTIENLMNLTGETETVTCYNYEEAIQPFPSYWPIQLLSKIESRIQQDHLSVIKLIQDSQPKLISLEDIKSFKNFNSPSDLS